MTLTDPVYLAPVPPINAVDVGFATIGTMQPFSPRTGIGYQDLLESIRVYIQNDLYNFLAASDPNGVWNANVDKLVTAVGTAITEAQTGIDSALAAQKAEVAQNLSDTLAQITAGTNADLYDAQIYAGLESANSTALALLDARYLNNDPVVFYARQNGVVQDGITDDTAAFNTLIGTAQALAKSAVIIFNTGATVKFTGTITIDVSLIRIVGDETTFSGGTFNFDSTASYSTRMLLWKDATSGIIFTGATLNIGSSAHTTVGYFRFASGGVIGCTTTILSNTWKISFHRFNIQGSGSTFTAPSTDTNTGENILFTDCFIGDGVAVNLSCNGDFHFTGCSIDNVTVAVLNAIVYFTDCHFENPGSGSNGYRYVTVGASGAVFIIAGQLVIDQPTSGNFNSAPFYVDPANLWGGLVVRGLQFPRASWISPAINDAIPVLVAGGGRAVFEGCTTFNTGSFPFVLSEYQNLLNNGTFEGNATTSWATSGTGTLGIDSTSGNHNRGTYSAKVTCAASQSLTVYQEAPVQPGKLLFWTQWWKATIGAGGSWSAQIDYYDLAGTKIGTVGYTNKTATFVGEFKTVWDIVPRGAYKARVTSFMTGGTGGVTGYFDDVIVNAA